MDGKFSVGYRDAVVRTVVSLDRETTAAYTLVLEAIGMPQPYLHTTSMALGSLVGCPSRASRAWPQEPGLEQRLCLDVSGERAAGHPAYH